MNACSFERCTHDRQNPYVMISREMAQDKSISPKAKGVLLYLLSLPPDWKIYHAQLQEGLGVGEDYINSAIDELLKEGYAERTRVRVKGVYQPYKYVIREFKKIVPNGESQAGLAGPDNPVIQSKERNNRDRENRDKHQQQARASEENSPKTSAADACEKSFLSDSIKYISPGGLEKTCSSSDIYRHFTKFTYKTETIKLAIEKVKEKRGPIGNMLRLLEVICDQIENDFHTSKKGVKTKSVKEECEKNHPPKRNCPAVIKSPEFWGIKSKEIKP